MRAAWIEIPSGAIAQNSASGPTSACGVRTPIRVGAQPSGCHMHISFDQKSVPGSPRECLLGQTSDVRDDVYCGLKPDITRGPKCATSGHYAARKYPFEPGNERR